MTIPFNKLNSKGTYVWDMLLGDKSDGSINEASLNPLLEINNLRLKNVNKVIIGNININSLPNKLDSNFNWKN